MVLGFRFYCRQYERRILKHIHIEELPLRIAKYAGAFGYSGGKQKLVFAW